MPMSIAVSLREVTDFLQATAVDASLRGRRNARSDF
jgi:hypothetical protein